MTIKIETKYNVGQKLYKLIGKDIEVLEVIKIYIESFISGSGHTTKVHYYIGNENNKICTRFTEEEIDRQYFSSKKEIFKKLFGESFDEIISVNLD